MGIEPTRPAWKAGILPLNYTRRSIVSLVILPQERKLVNYFFQLSEIFGSTGPAGPSLKMEPAANGRKQKPPLGHVDFKRGL